MCLFDPADIRRSVADDFKISIRGDRVLTD
jgi:hypothetical protein